MATWKRSGDGAENQIVRSDRRCHTRDVSRSLVCVECERLDELGHAWRAVIADDPDDDEPAEVAIYCQGCWDREFAASS